MKSISSVILAIVMALFAQVVAAETTYIDDYREVAMAAIEKSETAPSLALFYTAEGQYYAARYCKVPKDVNCKGMNDRGGVQIIRAYIPEGSIYATGTMYYFDYFPAEKKTPDGKKIKDGKKILDGKKIKDGKKILDGTIDHVYDSSGDSPFVPNAHLMRPPTKADQAAVEKIVRILADAIRRKVAK